MKGSYRFWSIFQRKSVFICFWKDNNKFMFHYLHFSKFETLAYRILVCDTVWSKARHEGVWPYAWRIWQLTMVGRIAMRQHDEENKSEAFSEYSAAHRTHWQLSPAGRRVQTRTTPAWKPYSYSFSRILKETERIFHPSPSPFIEKGLAKCQFSFMKAYEIFREIEPPTEIQTNFQARHYNFDTNFLRHCSNSNDMKQLQTEQ